MKSHRTSVLDSVVRLALALLAAYGVLYGARYSTKISAGDSPYMATLCTVVVVAGLLLVVRQWRTDATSNRIIRDVETVSRETRDLIYKLPHVRTIMGVAMAQRSVVETYEQVLRGDLDPTVGIQTSLSWLAQGVSRVSQHDGESTVIVANVMKWIPLEQYQQSSDRRTELQGRMPFCQELDLNGLHGVLEIQPELSAALESDAVAAPYPDLRHIVLPVHNDGPGFPDAQVNLPGAPAAAAGGEISYFGDTERILQFCRDTCHFLADPTRKQIANYFRERDIRSFVSWPLRVVDDGPLLGVLNLHSQDTDLLLDDPTARAVGYIMAPSLLAISGMLLEVTLD